MNDHSIASLHLSICNQLVNQLISMSATPRALALNPLVAASFISSSHMTVAS
jgi:hypothetical protein